MTTTLDLTVEQLREINPCAPMIAWLDECGITDLADAWDRCHRADWLLWLDGALDLLTDRERRLIACRVVRETPLGDGRKVWGLLADDRSRRAVAIAERYAGGAATDDQLSAAYADARAAADAAATYAARARASAVAAMVDAAAMDATDAARAVASAAAADAARAAAMAAEAATYEDAADAAYTAATTAVDAAWAAAADASRADAEAAARAAQADIVRAIAGNPWCAS